MVNEVSFTFISILSWVVRYNPVDTYSVRQTWRFYRKDITGQMRCVHHGHGYIQTVTDFPVYKALMTQRGSALSPHTLHVCCARWMMNVLWQCLGMLGFILVEEG